MKQLTVTGANCLEWREVPEPTLQGPQSAIVRPVAVSVCDFDRAVVAGRYPALPYPIAIGHEIVAEVIETGTEVHNLRAGMQVILPLHISCGACPPCGSGHTNSCQSRPPLSNYGLGARGGDWGGGMSDLLHVPFADAMAVPVPDGLSALDCVAIGCNMVDLYRTIAPHLVANPDPDILIVGGHAHNMALYGVVIARALGVNRVDFLDDDSDRLAAAAALGANPVMLAERPHAKLYPVVADCSGMPARLARALLHTGPDGVCTPVWPYTGSFDLPAGAMFLRNATLVTGQPHALALIEPVLELMQRTAFGSTSIPHEILPWDAAETEFGEGSIKRIFVR
ncbi:MAG TPA: alcohol dehydrogenase catalytic domain-containing protein [Sphingorhabdus sp.]|jgi:alcohol dehydrogenase|nr:alcohol dehydrogenase catalytic domain-containing protein [Sphingorhabdus sp.]